MKNEIFLKKIKEEYKETVVIVQIGAFCHVYGNDAYIISNLCGYQIKSVENSYNTCGFAKSAYEKVAKVLEENEINYIQIIKSKEYEIGKSKTYKKNKYTEIYKKAYKQQTIKNRVNEIYNFLIENINDAEIKNKIQKIENVLFEE